MVDQRTIHLIDSTKIYTFEQGSSQFKVWHVLQFVILAPAITETHAAATTPLPSPEL